MSKNTRETCKCTEKKYTSTSIPVSFSGLFQSARKADFIKYKVHQVEEVFSLLKEKSQQVSQSSVMKFIYNIIARNKGLEC